jgi:transcriptional regulator with XRE-family HTH domain
MPASDSLNTQVAAEIRAELARANITQAEFAQRCGWTPSTFSRRMSGEIPWNTDELEKVAAELGIDLAQLLNPVVRR